MLSARLAARPETARALLAEVSTRRLPTADLTAEVIRQMRNLKDAAVDKSIAEVWGSARETSGDKAQLVREYKKMIGAAPAGVRGSDPGSGRVHAHLPAVPHLVRRRRQSGARS
jgi:hypothetical protein